MADGIRIVEAEPNGEKSFKAFFDRMTYSKEKSDDMSPVFSEIIPEIQAEFRYEFSDANPADWKALTARYERWKIKNGFPVTIGIMTGALKDAITDSATVKIDKKSMVYAVNESISGYKGKLVGNYAKYFDRRRKIFPHVRDVFKKRIKDAVAAHLDWAKKQ